MDEVCRAIFDKVKSACTDGAAVFDYGELAGAVEGEELTPEKVDGAVKRLCGDGYIDIKYARGNLYCLAPIREPEDEKEDEPSPTVVEVKQKFSFKCALLYCAAALVGGAAGSAIASAIAAVL